MNVTLAHPPTGKPPASVHLYGGIYMIVKQLTHFLYEQQIRDIIPSLKKGKSYQYISPLCISPYLPLLAFPSLPLKYYPPW